VSQLVKDWKDPTKRNAMTVAQINQVQAWLDAHVDYDKYPPSEWDQVYKEQDTYLAAQKEKFSAQALADTRTYNAMSKDERAQWKKAFPDRYQQVKAVNNFKDEYGDRNPLWAKYYGFAASTSTGAAGNIGVMGGGVRKRWMGPEGVWKGRATTAPATLSGADEYAVAFDQTQYSALAQAAGDYTAKAAQLFGADILTLLQDWLGMDSVARLAWRKSHYAQYQRLLLFLMWLMSQGSASA
jgi:hypothetical protein